MKQLISPLWIRRLLVVAWMAVVIKALMLMLLFFLPKHGVELVSAPERFV